MSAATWDVEAGHPHRRCILAVLCLSLLIVTIDNTILNTALPSLARSLHASTTDLQWISDAYSLTFAALLIVAGALGDRYGRRKGLLLGMAVFGAGSMAAAFSSSSTSLIAAWAVMGIGGAFVMPATLSILSMVFPARERAAAIGTWSAVSGLGIVLGPTLGGLLLAHFSWSSVFWVNVPLAVVALVAVATVIPDLPGLGATNGRLDLVGAVLSAIGMVAVVDTLIEGPDRGWLSTTTLAEAAAGVLVLAAFAAWELRSAHPLIDLRIFRNRAFSAGSAAIALTFFALLGGLFAFTQYMQLVQGFSPLSSGLRAMPFAAAVLVIAPLGGTIAGRVGVRTAVSTGLTLLGAGLLLLTRCTPTTPYSSLVVCLALMGAGMALVVTPAGDALMSVLPTDQVGVGSALNDTVQELGGSIGVAVIGSVVSSSFRHGIDASGLPAPVASAARQSIAAADATAAQAGTLGPQVLTVAHDSFTTAMTHGFAVAGITAIVAAVALGCCLPRRVEEAAEASAAVRPQQALA